MQKEDQGSSQSVVKENQEQSESKTRTGIPEVDSILTKIKNVYYPEFKQDWFYLMTEDLNNGELIALEKYWEALSPQTQAWLKKFIPELGISKDYFFMKRFMRPDLDDDFPEQRKPDLSYISPLIASVFERYGEDWISHFSEAALQDLKKHWKFIHPEWKSFLSRFSYFDSLS